MPGGLSNAEIKAFAAALAARTRAQAQPSGVGVPQTSFGTDYSNQITPTFSYSPAQIEAFKVVQGMAGVGDKIGMDTDLQGRINSIETNQIAAGLEPHHSFLGSVLNRVADVLSRPIYAVGAFEDEGRTANQEGAGFFGTLGAAGKGFWHGLEGTSKTDIVEMLRHQTAIDEAKKQTSGDLSDYVEEHPELENKRKWMNLGFGLAGDISMDPLNFVFPGTAAKSVKDVPQLLKDTEYLSKLADEGAKLGVLPRTADGQHALITEDDIAKVTKEVSDELKAQRIYLDEASITRGEMVNKTAKTGNRAAAGAKKQLAENLRTRDDMVRERLQAISAMRASTEVPEDVRALMLKSHFNIDPENPTVGVAGVADNKWTRVTRANRADVQLSQEQLADSVRTAHETINDIVAAKRRAYIDTRLKKAAGPKPELLTDSQIVDKVEEFKQTHAEKLYSEFDDYIRKSRANVDESVDLGKQAGDLAKTQDKIKYYRTEISKIESYGPKARGKLRKRLEGMRVALKSAEQEEQRLKEIAENPTKAKAKAGPPPESKTLARIEKQFDEKGNITDATWAQWRREAEKHFDTEYAYMRNRLTELQQYGTDNIARLRRGQQVQWADKKAAELAAKVKRHADNINFPHNLAFTVKLAEATKKGHKAKFVANAQRMRREATISKRDELRKSVYAPKPKAPAKDAAPVYTATEAAVRENAVQRKLEQDAKEFAKRLRAERTAAKKSYYGKRQAAEEKVLKNADAMAYSTADAMDRAVRRNLEPSVVRRIGIAFPYTDRVVTIPGTGPILQAGTRFLQSDNRYNRYMRASAGVPSEVNARRLMYTGRAQFRIQKQNQVLFELWKDTSKQFRTLGAKAWRENQGVVIANDAGVDVVKWTDRQLDEIEAELTEYLGATAPQQLTRHLPAQLKLFGGESGHNPLLWTSKDKDTLKKGWLKSRLKEVIDRQLNSPNAKDIHKDFLQDLSKIVGSVRAGAEQAKTYKLMRDDFIANFGHSVRKVVKTEREKNPKTGKWHTKVSREDDVLTKSLKDKGYREVKIVDYRGAEAKTPPDMKDVLFEPSVAQGIEGIYKILSDDRIIKDYFQAYDKALRIWKTAITRYNPGYHERNLFGELFTAWLGGVKDPLLYSKAIKVLRKHDTAGLFKPETATAATVDKRAKRIANALVDDPVQAAHDAAKIMEPGEHASQRILQLRNGEWLTIDEIYHMFTQEAGLHTGFLAADVAEGVGSGRFGSVGRMFGNFNRAAQGATEGIEDSVRLMHFMDALRKSKYAGRYNTDLRAAVQDAAAEVRKYHHDFTDFTDFETNILARMFPFYKWTRKNLPLMAQSLFTQPGKVDKLFTLPMGLSIGLGFEREDGARIPVGGPLTPLWLQENGAVPIGHAGNGNVQLIDSPLPFLDALKMASHPVESTAFMMNPVVKVLMETASGHTTGGVPISGWQKYLAAQSPYSNIGMKAIKGGDQNNEGLSTALLQFLTGIGLQEDTKARMMSEAIRQASVASAQKNKKVQDAATP